MREDKTIYLLFRKSRVRVNIFALTVPVILILLESAFSVFVLFSCCLIHEAGHLAAMKILNVKRMRTDFEPFGMTLVADSLTPYRSEIAVALAGSAAGLTASLVSYLIFCFFPSFGLFYFASCGAILSIVNLLPLPSLDGGTAFRAFACLKRGQDGISLARTVGRLTVFLFILTVTALFAAGVVNPSLGAMGICSLMFVPEVGTTKKRKERRL